MAQYLCHSLKPGFVSSFLNMAISISEMLSILCIINAISCISHSLICHQGIIYVNLYTNAVPAMIQCNLHGGPTSQKRIQDSLLKLSPNLRTVTVLRYIEGLSYAEVAETLQCSIGTVKSRLNRAHKTLEDLLRSEIDFVRISDQELE